MRLLALIKAGNEKGEQLANDLVEILNQGHQMSAMELNLFNVIEVEDDIVYAHKKQISDYFIANPDGYILRHYYEDGIIKINGR